MAIGLGVLALYALGAAAGVAILIYVISKRGEDKKKEDFEQRDN